MMKWNAFAILFIVITQSLFSQTYINNGQQVFGTWKVTESPYIISGEAVVPSGATLEIQAGVVVKFKTGTDRDYRLEGSINSGFNVGFLRVEGKIIAKGSKTNRILFTKNGYGFWGNIVLDSRDNKNVFKYCIFEESYYMRGINPNENATGALSFINSSAMVEYCVFRNNGWTAINCKQSSKPVLKNLTIVGNKYGLECNTSSKPTFLSCIIWNNEVPFYVNGEGSPHVSFCLLQDYSLESKYDKGNNIYSKDPKFVNPENKDYNLKDNSPCRNTGIENKNMGAE